MQLRDLTTIQEFEKVLALERLIWGSTYDDAVTVPVFVITVLRGGVLIGAFTEDGQMVGFVYSIVGLKHGRPMQWSHMLGVVDAQRNSGVGRLLKLEQRQRTIARGLDLIEWTFDPLQALNAHLNFTKLGVVAREYEENIYGKSSSPLHQGSPTDRFVVEWWITAPHVLKRLENGPGAPAVSPDQAALVNRTRASGDWRACESFDLGRREPVIAVDIPVGFTDMLARDRSLAAEWRAATREIFTRYFAIGYTVVDFVLDRPAGFGRYLLADAGAAAPTLTGMGN